VDESLFEKTIKTLNKKWYQSDKVYRWMLTYENSSWQIKRNVLKSNGQKTFQRLPKKLYKHLSKKELDKLLTRLNYNQMRERRMREGIYSL
jgi:hypothetical protein